MASAEAIAAFEHACLDAHAGTAPAEHTLAQLTSHADAIPLALAVAQHTQSPVARFHAAATLRNLAASRWHSLPPSQRHGPASLRNWLVEHVFQRPNLLPFETSAMLRTAASLARRAYLEEPSDTQAHFYNRIFHIAAAPTPTAQAATQLLEHLVDEFHLPASPTAPGMLTELLHRTRQLFDSPAGHAAPIFTAALHALSVSAHPTPALSAIHKILTSDSAPRELTDDAEVETVDAVVINTFRAPHWLTITDQLPLLLRLALRYSASPSHPSAPKAAAIIVAISAISHDSFRDPSAASALLAAVLDAVNEQAWISSSNPPLRLAYAEVWRRVSCAHGLNGVVSLGPSYLQLFANDTCAEMDATALRLARDVEEDVFSMDAADILLETWANLALQGDDGAQDSEHALADPIERVLFHFIRMSLRSTDEAAQHSTPHTDTEEDLGFDDASVDESRLSAAAILTRFVLVKIAPAVAQSLLQTAHKVFNWTGVQPPLNIPLDLFQEDLYFLIQLTAAVLADEAKGEYPSVPIQFLSSNSSITNGPSKVSHHAHILLSSLFEVSQKETKLIDTRNVHCNQASPRIATSLLEALTRITRTYLVPVNESTASAAFDAIGGVSVAISGRTQCFVKSIEGISRRAFEPDIATAAARLLSTLAAGAPRYPDIRESHAWQQLLRAGVEAYQTLPPLAVQDIGKSLTIVMGDVVADGLLLPAYKCLQNFAQVRDRVPDAADRAIATLNLFRGAARCEKLGPRSKEALLHSLRAPDGIAAVCAKSFGATRPDVARTLINLADDIVSTRLALLSEAESRDLLTNAVKLVKLHTEILAVTLNETSPDDTSCDVEDILLLMTRILDEEAEIDVGEACFYALSTLMPVMTETILALPDVSDMFFRFTTRLVSTHPEKVALLPAEFCAKILHTIELQRVSYEVGQERRGLEAISLLARSRVLEKKDGSGSVVVDSALLRLLNAIFNGIATGSAHTANLDAAADALLALIHVKHASSDAGFESISRALVQSSGNSPLMRNAVQELAHAAFQAGALHGYQGRQNLPQRSVERRAVQLQAAKSFREAVSKFSADARKCLVSVAIGTTETQ